MCIYDVPNTGQDALLELLNSRLLQTCKAGTSALPVLAMGRSHRKDPEGRAGWLYWLSFWLLNQLFWLKSWFHRSPAT